MYDLELGQPMTRRVYASPGPGFSPRDLAAPLGLAGAWRVGKAAINTAKKHWEYRTRANERKKKFRQRYGATNPLSIRSGRSGLRKKRGRTAKRKNKSKMTLKKKVAKIEKRLSSDSTYHFKTVYPVALSTDGAAQAASSPVTNNGQYKIVFFVRFPYGRPDEVEAELNTIKTDDGVTNYDFSSSTTNPKVDLSFFNELFMKNNGASNCRIKYVFWRCKDHNSSNVNEDFKEQIDDRNYPGWTTNSGKAQGLTNSFVPSFCTAGSGNGRAEVLSLLDKSSHYATVGKIVETYLNPGDSFSIYHRHKYTYRPEIFDNLPTTATRLKDLYRGVAIQIEGELMHDKTNHSQVGFSAFHVDGIQKSNMTVKIDNGLGQNFVTPSYSQFVDSSNGWETVKPNVVQKEDIV